MAKKAQPVIMPKFGQTVEEATIVKWLKNEGDSVAKGEVLFEIETDKATLEVESFLEGTLLKRLVNEQDTVPVQSTVAFVGNEGDEIPEVVQVSGVRSQESGKKEQPRISDIQQGMSKDEGTLQPPALPDARRPATPPPPQRLIASPKAKKLAKDKAISLVGITGTGAGGRIVSKDVEVYLSASGYESLRITPAALNMARKEEIDVLKLKPKSTSKRISVNDVKRAISEKPQKMSKMRQVIAARLTESFSLTPHIFVTVSVDMTDLLAFRKKLKAAGESWSVTDFIMRAVVDCLVEHPVVNSTTDGISTRWHASVDLGLAVALEQGLVVPVIREAETLSLAKLHEQAAEVVGKAREGKLAPDEMTGSTFTISNMGMLDVENFTAIINPGEGAILAVCSTIDTPVVRKKKVVVRQMMKMTLSADHRMIDGAMAAAFVNAIKDKLEDVQLWKSLT